MDTGIHNWVMACKLIFVAGQTAAIMRRFISHFRCTSKIQVKTKGCPKETVKPAALSDTAISWLLEEKG